VKNNRYGDKRALVKRDVPLHLAGPYGTNAGQSNSAPSASQRRARVALGVGGRLAAPAFRIHHAERRVAGSRGQRLPDRGVFLAKM